MLLGDEARTLLDSIDVSTVIGLRDRALIALLIYSFARISAALQMDVDDYYPQGKRWWVRLHEKGGKQREMPAHHLLEQYLDAYVAAAGITAEKNTPLFRTLGGRGRKQLTPDRMTRQDARRMIVRRAKKAGLLTRLGCHSFRATGITVYLLNGGLLEFAQQMAAHESARTTSSTIAATTKSRSIKSSGLCCSHREGDRGFRRLIIEIVTKAAPLGSCPHEFRHAQNLEFYDCLHLHIDDRAWPWQGR